MTKTGDYAEAITNATAALQIDMDNSAKALYLRSIANLHLKKFTDAMADCRQAILQNPSDKALRQPFELCKSKANEAKQE